MKEWRRAVILARVSSKAQEDEGYSLDSQLKLLESYCQNKELTVVRVFKIAETASKEKSRRIFHEMLEYITKNNVYHLAVEKTDRFTRNFRDAVAIDEWLDQDANRRLHAVKENILLHKEAKSDVKFMWSIHLSVAKKYTDNLREEAMKGWAEKLEQGWLPAPPPPGYKTITQSGKRIHVPDPETKELMHHIFKKYLEPGQNLRLVCEEMNRLGIHTRLGKPYTKSNVHKILTNPFYVGVNRFNGKDYPGAQEPLISDALFKRVQKKMHAGKPNAIARHNPTLKGVVQCLDCGSAVTWQLQKGRYYGVCRRLTDACKKGKMLREEAIEDNIKLMLRSLVSPSPEVIDWVADAMRKHYQESIENRERQAQAIQNQISRIERMDEGLYDDKLAGEITKEKYNEKHEQFIKQKGELAEKLDELDTTAGLRLEQRLVIFELSQKAAQIYAKKTPDQKRLIISKLFTKLTLKEGSVSVEYTKFAQAIAENVQKTRNLMEAQK